MTGRIWVLAGAVAAGMLLTTMSTAQPPVGRIGNVPKPVNRPGAPVVVELFTAQGCGGCVDANTTVARMADAPGVIALTYGVDYWDYLGWQDTFAQPKFSERQRAYQAALRQRGVATPQVVIDGRRQVSGARGQELQIAIEEEAARQVWPPQIEFRESGNRVGIGSGRAPSGGADVVAITYTPGVQTVDVQGGENRGREIRHANVVRDVSRLGEWQGRPVLYPLPQARDGDAIAVLIQSRSDRHILAAATVD